MGMRLAVANLSVILLLCCAFSFGFYLPFSKTRNAKLHASTSAIDVEKSWQEELDVILNVDTSCQTRVDTVTDILKKADVIVKDLTEAVQEKNISRIAPTTLGYGKAVEGLKAFRRQLFTDLLPELLVNDGPKFLQDAPKLINELLTDAPDKVSKAITRGQKLAETVTDISKDPSMLQSTIDDVRREAKNIFKSVPEGLETPQYIVLKKTDLYEIRSYSSYSVCSTELKLDADQSTMSPLVTAKGFNTLADYLFGNNNEYATSEKLSMTTPVIITGNSMEFVLPSDKSSTNAPVPVSGADVIIKDIQAEYVAVLEFPGIATDGEVMRQRALLEDALLTDGITYDNLAFKVLQYNSPLTLPWLRRNEVSIGVTLPAELIPSADANASSSSSDEGVLVAGSDASTFFSSPEAGD